MISSGFVLLSEDLATWGLCGSINILEFFSAFKKSTIENLIGIVLNLYRWLWVA